jgi:Xaa-Pro dipeptidase
VPAYYLHPHHYERIRQVLGSNLVQEATNLVHDLSLVKSSTEISYIRRAATIADEAMLAFTNGLLPGRSELNVAGDVYAALFANGSGLSASPINIVSGERSCYSHGAPTERVLIDGDFGSVEYGATYRRYTATIGRQFCLGQPTQRMVELYEVVRRACDASIAEIRDGAPAIAPHEAAKRVIGAAGLEHGRVHTTGYGLAPGFPPTWGEPVHMIGGSDYILRAGMVLSVEPPIFLGEERLGARIIDNVLVTEAGCELLSRFSRDLIVVT